MIICSSTARRGTCTRQAAEAGGGSPIRGADWFTGRRDHFVRQAIGDFFHLASSFAELYASWRGSAAGAHPLDDATSSRLQAQLAAEFAKHRRHEEE